MLLSILFTRRDKNLPKISSIVTAFIPLSSIFSTWTFSLQAERVFYSIYFLNYYGNILNKSYTV